MRSANPFINSWAYGFWVDTCIGSRGSASLSPNEKGEAGDQPRQSRDACGALQKNSILKTGRIGAHAMHQQFR